MYQFSSFWWGVSPTPSCRVEEEEEIGCKMVREGDEFKSLGGGGVVSPRGGIGGASLCWMSLLEQLGVGETKWRGGSGGGVGDVGKRPLWKFSIEPCLQNWNNSNKNDTSTSLESHGYNFYHVQKCKWTDKVVKLISSVRKHSCSQVECRKEFSYATDKNMKGLMG